MQYLFSSSLSQLVPSIVPSNLNLEGLSSAIRIAMMPYAPKTIKISLIEEALVLEKATALSGISRTLANSSHLQIIVVKRVIRIMLNLFPLKGELESSLTQIYKKVITGLKHFDKHYFSSIKTDSVNISDSDLESFDYDHESDYPPDEKMAAAAVRKTIAILKYSLDHHVNLDSVLTPIQKKVKDYYTEQLLSHFDTALNLLKQNANDSSICEHYYNSVYSLTEASLEKYKCFQKELATLHDTKKNSPPSSVEQDKA